jgi:PAS domain S-box-containing protein
MAKHRFLGFTPSLVAETIVRIIGDILIVLNKERKVAFINRTAAKTLGYDPSRVTGMKVREMIKDIDMKLHKTEDTLSDFETTAVTSDGVAFPVTLNASSIRDGQGELLGYVLSANDARESEKMLAELKFAHDERLRSTRELEKFNTLLAGRAQVLNELHKELEDLEKKSKR